MLQKNNCAVLCNYNYIAIKYKLNPYTVYTISNCTYYVAAYITMYMQLLLVYIVNVSNFYLSANLEIHYRKTQCIATYIIIMCQ